MSPERFGYLYVATGQKYVEEAILSAQSLVTRYPVGLVTDELLGNLDYSVFDDVQLLELGSKSGLLFKVAGIALQNFYQSFVFLDSDTRIAKSIDWMDDLGDYCDFAAAIEHGRGREKKVDEPVVLQNICEYNTGVLYVSGSSESREVLEHWYTLYQLRSAFDFHDQFSFLLAISKLSAKVLILGSEFNFRCNQISVVDGAVHIFHGRVKNWSLVERRIANSASSIGAWLPRFKCFIDGRRIHKLANLLGRVGSVFNNRW